MTAMPFPRTRTSKTIGFRALEMVRNPVPSLMSSETEAIPEPVTRRYTSAPRRRPDPQNHC